MRWLASLGLAGLLWSTSGHGAEPLPVTQIAPGIYVFHGAQEDMTEANQGNIANLSFVVGDKVVAVIDTGGSLKEGERLKAAIAKVTPLPVKYIILTHIHPDHIFGTSAFTGPDLQIIGHAKLPDEIAARGEYYLKAQARMIGEAAATGSTLAPPKIVITQGSTVNVDLGGRQLAIHTYLKAHTDTDLTVFDDKTGTFFLGDLLFVERIPSLDGSVTGWLKAIDQLSQIKANRAVPGHGPVSVPWPAAIEPERRYLSALTDQTRAAIKKGVGIAEATKTLMAEERSKWLLFDDYNPHNVTAAYKELEWE
jgi:quinoprotein relay system zinc metallohydrolase 2